MIKIHILGILIPSIQLPNQYVITKMSTLFPLQTTSNNTIRHINERTYYTSQLISATFRHFSEWTCGTALAVSAKMGFRFVPSLVGVSLSSLDVPSLVSGISPHWVLVCPLTEATTCSVADAVYRRAGCSRAGSSLRATRMTVLKTKKVMLGQVFYNLWPPN